ncbi:hypothetical protein ACFQ9X_00325 [Catenulispora yoronensis]
MADLGAAGADGGGLLLAALTPRIALDAGQRIVLTVLEAGTRRRALLRSWPKADGDPVKQALLAGVRTRQAERYDLVRNPEFWNASQAVDLAAMRDGTAEARELARLQDAGEFEAAWQLAGFSLSHDAGLPSRMRWLAALPVRLSGLAERVRAALPEADTAVLRSGTGAVILSGLAHDGGAPHAHAVSHHEARGLPTIANAVWARSVDVDLLRHGFLGVQDLHPLVASALATDLMPLSSPEAEAEAGSEAAGWLYQAVPFIAEPCSDAAVPTLWIQCGAARHRVAYVDGTWQPIDHVAGAAHAARESLLHRLGGPANPCMQATLYLSSGRHVIDLAESLLHHGRAAEVVRVVTAHAGAQAALDELDLPAGGTVGEALATLHENTLQLRMLLAGATRQRETPSYRSLPTPMTNPSRRPSRKGVSSRTHRWT